MRDTPRDLDVVVLGGGGHVGLPLSLALAEAGLCVGIYDTAPATLERIGAGEMPFLEGGAQELLAKILPTGRLELSGNASMLSRTDQVVVVIGTPVDEFLAPSMTIFEKAVDQISPHLRAGALVVLRSTVYPGTTAYVAQHPRRRTSRPPIPTAPICGAYSWTRQASWESVFATAARSSSSKARASRRAQSRSGTRKRAGT